MQFYKTLSFAAAMIIAVQGAKAQTSQIAYKLKGIIVDSLSREGEPYATLNIVRPEAKDKPLVMAVTDQDGRFEMNAKGSGHYLLIARSVGRNTIERPFNVDGKSNTIDLGTLLCSDSSTSLAGVEVVAYKPLVKADVDKLTYSVENDAEAQTLTVTDMLKKVPMVTVDADDNISVKGSTSFKVYVNGKPNNMMTNNAKQVLKSMPASSIKKIEVITNPGPKYDAEGVGGILNIITTGKALEGFTATVSAKGSNRGVGGGVFATMKADKLTLSVNYNTDADRHPRTTQNSVQAVLDDEGRETRRTETNAQGLVTSRWHAASLEASYEIDSLRLITASFSLNSFRQNNTITAANRSYVPLAADNLYSYMINNRARNSYNGISGGLDYQRSFRTPGRMLTLSYRVESTPATEKANDDYHDLFAQDAYADFIANINDQRTDAHKSTAEHTFQIDYASPFAKIYSIEAGAKYILRQNRATTDKYDAATDGSDETYDEQNSAHYKHSSDIFAAYLGYGLNTAKWSARAGLRYEHTLQNVKYLLGRGENFSKRFNDFVPSLKLGYNFNETTTIGLNYKMRISRPGIWMLNPYLDDSNPQQLSQGNSNLMPEKIHSFDLQFASMGQKLNYTLSLGYDFTNNSIESVAQMLNDNDIEGLPHPTGTEVLYTTYHNIGHRQNVRLDYFMNWNVLKNTRLLLNGSGEYTKYSDGQSTENHGWSMRIYANIEQTIAKTWKVTAGAFKTTPNITLQGKGAGLFVHSLSVSKSWLDQRLNVSLTAQNPFGGRLHLGNNTSGNNFSSSTLTSVNLQKFTLGVSFRFGKLQSGVKKAHRSIVNDDVKQSGSNNGSGAAGAM